jgi:hypothetical protein
MEKAREAFAANTSDHRARFQVISSEYIVSKYLRKDNTPENARYLGYLDTRELYPDFKPRTFGAYVDELLAGKSKKLYQNNAAFLRAVSKNDK